MERDERFERAETALEEFFRLVESGEPVTFESWCSNRSEIALELRDLFSVCELLRPGAPAGARAPELGDSTIHMPDPLSELGRSPNRFSEYDLEREPMAEGGMGSIFGARDRTLHRSLAMKVLRHAIGSAPEDVRRVARFVEEARLTSQLDHPGIVPVHEIGLDTRGRPYFTMKRVQGEAFDRILERVARGETEWTLARALTVLKRVCEAVAFAHQRGVIHRDIKPANVMVGGFGEVYVMDWGLARIVGLPLDPGPTRTPGSTSSVASHTQDGDVMGTPAYMAPEQAQGRLDRIGRHSDVYSVGAMLYELLSGRPPYAETGVRLSSDSLLELVRTGPPKELEQAVTDAHPELVAICKRAMDRDWHRRYPDMSALSRDLEAYLEGRVVSAHEAGRWAELRKWVQRNRGLAGAAGMALAILIVGIATTTIYAIDAHDQALRADEKAEEARLNAVTAALNAARAIEQEGLATALTNDVLSLSASEDLRGLVARAAGLWPPHPQLIPEYERWMEEARVLIEGYPASPDGRHPASPGLEEHKATLARVLGGAGVAAESVGSTRASTDALRRDQWWHNLLTTLIDDLEVLRDPDKGLYSEGSSPEHGWGIPRRLKFALSLVQRDLPGSPDAAAWRDAIEAIRDSPRYNGFVLAPQTGLVPIGIDPRTELWEFAHLQSGEPAARDTSGRLVLESATGIVLVLLPPGEFWMGAQPSAPDARNFDPAATEIERPLQLVVLDAFFLSKYEMTQGQWNWAAGKNPSVFCANNFDTKHNAQGRGWSPLHPVEQVSWIDCDTRMRELGLSLPTEAQWEYGCRAGTTTVYWAGDEPSVLQHIGNVADAYAQAFGGESWSAIFGPWDDGNTIHAQVGSYRANAFGLHDVHGNVWEWCSDGGPYSQPVRPGDGMRLWDTSKFCSIRGGGFPAQAANARSAYRDSASIDFRSISQGLRPALRITPP